MNAGPNNKHQITLAILVVFAASAAAGPVYSFVNITGNSAAAAQVGQSQLSVEVNDAGVGQVWFTFRNAGADPSSIAQIYFDDGPAGAGILSSIAGIDNSDPGVSFSVGAKPSNLPGGNGVSPNFTATQGLSASADNPAPAKGVNPGESVGLLTNLANGSTYFDVLGRLTSDQLRIGLHVQSFADGSSESFITTVPQGPNPTPPIVVVPTPGAMLMGSLGMGCLIALRKRLLPLR